MSDLNLLALVFGVGLVLVIAATVGLVASGRSVHFPPERTSPRPGGR